MAHWPASFPRYRITYYLMLSPLLGVVAYLALFAVWPGAIVHGAFVGIGVVVVYLVAALVASVYAATTGSGRILIEGDGLVVDRGRRRTSYRLSGADIRYGKWAISGTGATGSLLYLSSGGKRLRIAGRDLLLPDDSYTESPRFGHDAELTEAAFAQLIAQLGRVTGKRVEPRDPAAGDLSVELIENRGAPRWTMKLAGGSFGLVFAGGCAALLTDSLPGVVRFLPLAVWAVSMIAFLVMMVRVKRFRLALHGGELVLQTARGRELWRAPQSEMTWERGAHRVGTRFGSAVYPVLVVTGPGRAKLSVTTADPKVDWPNPRRVGAARYVIGPPEWRYLLRALRVTS